mmetsp:Transcript_53457/g.173944  ORF Transcript_53457/g.173944 Transcript_53457/m.173944 type:complete len:115 (-) Transcript_53457:229-573(-)
MSEMIEGRIPSLAPATWRSAPRPAVGERARLPGLMGLRARGGERARLGEGDSTALLAAEGEAAEGEAPMAPEAGLLATAATRLNPAGETGLLALLGLISAPGTNCTPFLRTPGK